MSLCVDTNKQQASSVGIILTRMIPNGQSVIQLNLINMKLHPKTLKHTSKGNNMQEYMSKRSPFEKAVGGQYDLINF